MITKSSILKTGSSFLRICRISLWKTIYFNFRYFPIRQALVFPVIVYSGTKIRRAKGKIIFDCPIKKGIVKLGYPHYDFAHKHNPSIWCDRGGTIVFGENVDIGSGSFINIRRGGTLIVGSNALIGGNLHLTCYSKITIGINARVAWDVTIVDTDFHHTINIHSGERSIPIKRVEIGSNNWIGFGTTILKGVKTSDFCVIGAKSLLIKEYDFPPYVTLAGIPAKKVAEGFFRDLDSFL